MSSTQPNASNSDLSLSTSDIYRAAEEGVILMADAERIVKRATSSDSKSHSQHRAFHRNDARDSTSSLLLITLVQC